MSCLFAAELATPGKYITLRNAKIDMYRGSMRLAVDQWGKVEPLDNANFKANVGIEKISSHCSPQDRVTARRLQHELNASGCHSC